MVKNILYNLPSAKLKINKEYLERIPLERDKKGVPFVTPVIRPGDGATSKCGKNNWNSGVPKGNLGKTTQMVLFFLGDTVLID